MAGLPNLNLTTNSSAGSGTGDVRFGDVIMGGSKTKWYVWAGIAVAFLFALYLLKRKG